MKMSRNEGKPLFSNFLCGNSIMGGIKLYAIKLARVVVQKLLRRRVLRINFSTLKLVTPCGRSKINLWV
jgi:hypothetical protein